MTTLISAGAGLPLQIIVLIAGIFLILLLTAVLYYAVTKRKNDFTIEFIRQEEKKFFVAGGTVDLTHGEIEAVWEKYENGIRKSDKRERQGQPGQAKAVVNRECVGIFKDYNPERTRANYYVGRNKTFDCALEQAIPAGDYAKVTVTKPANVPEAYRALKYLEAQRDYKCDFERFREDGVIEVYVSLMTEGGEPAAAAREEKTAALPENGWYEIEREKLDDILDQDADPIAYIEKEMAKKDTPADRKLALKQLKEELLNMTADLEDEFAGDVETVKVTDTEESAEKTDVSVLNKARMKYVSDKKAGKEAEIVPLAMVITREDVLDYVSYNMTGERHPVKTVSRPGGSENAPWVLGCGDRNFGLVGEKHKVVKLTLRLGEEDAVKLQTVHTGIKRSKLMKSSDYFDVVTDCSYVSKKEVFELLELSYAYVLKRYFKFDDTAKKYISSADDAVEDALSADAVTESAFLDTEQFAAAVQERREAASAYRKQFKDNGFRVSRAALLKCFTDLGHEGVSLVERVAYRPFSLRYKNKTFAMVYEQLGQVKAIIRAPKDYIETLEINHPVTYKARFPKGRDWYVVMLDGSYKTMSSCYKVLKKAYDFISSK